MKRKKGNNISMWTTAYLFLLPAFILWLVWFCIPMFQSFGLSFYKYNYIMPGNNHFVGLSNYINLFKDNQFIYAIKSTLTIVLVAVPIQTAISMLMALTINNEFKGRGFFRTLFYAPYVISPYAVATVFIAIFAVGTPIMNLMKKIGFADSSLSTSVKAAVPLIIIMFVWQQVGLYMVMFLSGLQTIPNEIMASAQIDGANKLQKFRFITLPMLSPTTFLVITYGIISSFQIFDQISAIAGQGVLGSPGGALTTLVVYFYLNSFKYGEIGYGSAAAVILFVLIFTVTLIQKKFLDKDITA